jgi:hypothetical protein
MRYLRAKGDVTDLKFDDPACGIVGHDRGRYVFTQVLDLVYRQASDRLIKGYDTCTRDF